MNFQKNIIWSFDLHYFLDLQITYLPDAVNFKPCSTPCLPYDKFMKDDDSPFDDVTSKSSLDAFIFE